MVELIQNSGDIKSLKRKRESDFKNAGKIFPAFFLPLKIFKNCNILYNKKLIYNFGRGIITSNVHRICDGSKLTRNGPFIRYSQIANAKAD